MWLADMLGIDVQITTSTNMNGRQTVNTYNQQSSRGGRRAAGSSTTYTSRSTRTVIENGRRVTIQSLEKDGNKIEEKYIGTNLVERTINGQPERIGRIEGDL